MSTRSSRPSRRELLQWAALATAGGVAGIRPRAARAADPPAKAPPKLPQRILGTTGRSVSMLCLGTGTIAERARFDEVVEVLRHGLDAGITYVDTAPSYNAEKQVGKAIAGRRKELFLATKTLARDYDGARRELDQSLRNLGVERLDLWQVHSIGHAGASGAEELRRLRDPAGVMKAMRQAKEEKIVDYIGFTGHTDPEYMLSVLKDDELEFDTMLFIVSAALARANQRGWEDDVLPAGRKRGLGLIAMKVFGGGGAVGKGEQRASPEKLLHYVWDLPVATANVGLYTRDEVDAAVAALSTYKPKKETPTDGAGGGGNETKPDDRREASRARLRARLHGVALPFEQADYVDACRARA